MQKREKPDAKGYWIARIRYSHMDGYKEYNARRAVFVKFGAKFLVPAANTRSGKAHPIAQCGAGIQGL